MTPTHAATPCLEPGCYNLAARAGRCATCYLLNKKGEAGARTAYDQDRGSARDRGYDARWERRRRRHLAIEPTCRVCADGQLGNELDHVIPHRGARWLFDLKGNLQTLCKHHHSQKSARERSIPIGMLYPLDLPEPPHARPTSLLCGPVVGEIPKVAEIVMTTNPLWRNHLVHQHLLQQTDIPLVLIEPAPRTAERAFWSHVMGCRAELELPIHNAIENHPTEWWADYMLDQRAEEAMARRSS